MLRSTPSEMYNYANDDDRDDHNYNNKEKS